MQVDLEPKSAILLLQPLMQLRLEVCAARPSLIFNRQVLADFKFVE